MTTAYDQLLLDLFTTAIEGGINYWSQVSVYHWSGGRDLDWPESDYAGFHAVIHETESDEEPLPEYRIDRSVIVKGYRLATEREWRNKLRWSSGEKPPFVITDDTDWDFDAGDADMIVQLGLFGEIIYG